MNKLIVLLILLPLSMSAYSDVDLVLVKKSARMMYLLENGHIVKHYPIALGAAPQGHKQQQGDEKTPEGVYQLDYKNEHSSYYRSIHISYPNNADQQSARKRGVSPGGDIMIHGQKNGYAYLTPITQRFNWTNGCIAISNQQMDELMALVKTGTQIRIEW